jgi:predicted metal-binding membrane protein
MHAPTARFVPRPGLDGVIIATVLVAWGLMLALLALEQTAVIQHDAILADGRLAWPLALVVFVAAWQLMTAAMMLPTSLPMVRAFAVTVRGQRQPRLALTAFLAGYFVIWTGFAFAALGGDALLHGLVDHWTWLADRPGLIGGTMLTGAGAFQFSPLKERCLAECRSPLQFLWRHYRRGVGGAWQLGLRHGIFCVGCCWALMLVMFAVGIGSLAWMAGLTGVMLVEKTSRWGRRLIPIVGVILIGWGLLTLLPAAVASGHAGEIHARAGGDPLLGAAVVVALAAGVTWWRRRSRPSR